MHPFARIVFALCLLAPVAHAQEPPAAPSPELVREEPILPRLSDPNGAEDLALLVDVPWEALGDGEARDFPVLMAHWGRVSTAFFGYSSLMAQGEPVMKEWSVIAPRMLTLGSMLARSGRALVEALPPNDSTREARAQGVAAIVGGLHKMTQGSLLVLAEMPGDVRGPYVRDLSEAVPRVIALMPQEQAIALQAQARGAALGLPATERAQLEASAGSIGEDLPVPPLADGAPDRLLVAQTAAGWPGAMEPHWAEAVLAVDWAAHATDLEAQKADAYALLLAAQAWQKALGEGRTEGLDTPSALVDAALRASAGVLASDAALPDPADFRRAVGDLVLAATATAAHHSGKDREPLVDALQARLPGLLDAFPEDEAGELHASLRSVADRKLMKALGL